ncbi:MAG TPA: SCO family protein [Candidatus Acidoferrales bacterium]|nr:SCO family protein [Candidatus Acidoferrales bacterium]
MKASLATALVLASALLGGCAHHAAPDFTLTSDTGAPWTLSAQRGEAVAVFFGFTHCDDTCPDTLAKLSTAMRADGASARDAEIAFVTIDPQRDTPAVMHRYIRRFDGPVVGLTGTPAQIAAVMRAYHVWAQKIPDPHGGSNYDEAHSAFTFLIDRNGNMRMIHNDNDSLRDFRTDLAILLR